MRNAFWRTLALKATSGCVALGLFLASSVRAQTWSVGALAGQAAASGSADGAGRAARFNTPAGMAVDPAGYLYVADTWNNAIRKIAPDGTTTTLAGGQSGSADGTGTNAQFNFPTGVAVDTNGNVYVADRSNDTIRRISAAGVVTTLAGLAGSWGLTATGAPPGCVDGVGTNARFSHPSGVALDPAGNVYVADTWNNRIRMIAPSGAVSTLTGPAQSIFQSGQSQVLAGGIVGGGADGPATNALFYYPTALAVDASTNVYIADTGNNTIRMLSPNGTVSTVAGLAGALGAADGLGTNARFAAPQGIQVDGFGNLYVADSFNHTIREITASGVVTTLAGQAGVAGSTDAKGTNALFNEPFGLALGANGGLLVAEAGNDSIRQMDSNGVAAVLAGPGGSLGADNGIGPQARFGFPTSVAVDATGAVYVADLVNYVVRKIDTNGTATVLAGQPGLKGAADGPASNSLFAGPRGVAVDGAGNVYVADADNQTIRLISDGVVSTLAGQIGRAGSTNGTGTNALFNDPTGVAVDGSGNVYVADGGNNLIRRITPSGASWVVTTLAGHPIKSVSGVPSLSYMDGTGTNAGFYNPSAVAVDGAGNIYVADQWNETVRMITPTGVVTTLAGTPGAAGSGDGAGAKASFSSMGGLASDAAGNIYVADTYNNTIRMISPSGATVTLGGSPGVAGSADGLGTNALFSQPYGIAVDSAGRVFAADTLNNTIRVGILLPAVLILQITGSTGQVILSWFSVTNGFVLQTRPSLLSGVSWTTLTNSPAQAGGQFMLTNPAADAAAFFRLSLP